MKISLIVPFYNVEPYLEACLESIIHQSYRDLEIILIDDASPDQSYAIAQRYAQEDDRIILIRHAENRGLGGARNSGLAVATGAYVWFIDSDDEILSLESVAEIVQEIERAGDPDMIGFGAITLYENGFREAILHDVKQRELFRDRQALGRYRKALDRQEQAHSPLAGYAWHKWYKRSFWDSLGMIFLEKTLFEDLFLLLSFDVADRVLLLSSPHYLYRKRAGSILHSSYPPDFDAHMVRSLTQVHVFYQMHQEKIPPQSYYQHLQHMTKMSSFFGDSWRRVLSHSLRREAERSLALCRAVALVWSPLDGEQRQRFGALEEVTPEAMARVEAFLTRWQEEGEGIHAYHALSLFFTPQHAFLKALIRNVLPFGLLKIVLDKRQWAVIIKAKNSVR